MIEFDTTAFFTNLGIAAAALLLLWIPAVAIGRARTERYTLGMVRGAGFVVVGIVSYLLSTGHGDNGRRLLLLLLVTVWGLWSVSKSWRSRNTPAVSAGSPKPSAAALRYLLGAAAVFFISLPVQVGMYAPAPLGFVTFIGIGLWVVGMLVDAVVQPRLAPGFWGDAAAWWGIFLVGADSWPGVLTIVPAAVDLDLEEEPLKLPRRRGLPTIR